MQKQRNNYLDLLKGILVFLVVLGHFIQYIGFGGNSDCFNNKLFKLIYMFHMPLFLGISGYLTYFSVKKYSFSEFLNRRIPNLIIPMSIWCIINSILIIFITRENNIHEIGNITLNSFLSNYWFVWAIIIYSFILAILVKYRLDKIPVFLVICLILMSLPFNNFLFNILETMFPFFVIGYVIAKTDIDRIVVFCKRYVLIFIAVSIICFLVWEHHWYVYYSQSSWQNITITVVRLFAGVSLSVSFMVIIYQIYKMMSGNRLIIFCEKLGQESLAIYLAQGFAFTIIMRTLYVRLADIYNTLLLIIPALLLTILLYLFIKITERGKLGWLLYGKRH